MKTKNLIKLGFITIAVVGITVSGCKKKNNDETPTDTTSLSQVSKDENYFSIASDDAMMDANDVVYSAKEIQTVCDATVSNSTSGDTIIRSITYNGISCPAHPFRLRTGQIIVKRLTNTTWGTPLATIWVTFVNYKVTKNNKFIIINGTKTLQNVTGGFLSSLNGSNTITHQVTGVVQVTFDDNTTRSWNIARKKTFSGTYPNQLVLKIEGIGSSNNYSNLVVWGINRHGEQFYTQINQPIIHNQICAWNPDAGVKVFQIPSDNKKAIVTFGYNSQNQPVTVINGTSDCPTKYKLEWEKNNATGTIYDVM
jgi:hypothetical protein